MFNSYLLIYLLLAIIVSSIISLFAWKNRETHGSKFFALTCLLSIIWMLGEIIGRYSGSLNGQWIGMSVRYFGVCSLPVALFVFIHQYCGKKFSSNLIKWLWVVPLISWLLVVTNNWHFLFFQSVTFDPVTKLKTEYGIYFWWVHLPYSYSLFLLGFIRVLVEFSRASRHYRKQILFLLVAMLIPFFVNFLGIFKIITSFSYTPLSFPFFFSLMAYAMFRHQFLGSNPIGYKEVFQTIRDGVLILDRNDVIRDINPAAAHGLGKKPAEVIGTFVREAFGNWKSAVRLYDEKPFELGEIEVFLYDSVRYLSIESTPLANSTGVYEGRIITIRDITDKHRHQLSLEMMAFHDPLTRLANRRKFQEEVELALDKADETKEKLAIIYIDLNRFKFINDTLGHEVGDEFLKYVAARIASVLRKPDTLARLGGDEFALLLHNCDESGVDSVVERIMQNVKRPFKVGENTLIADLSLGAAYYPQDGKNLTELLRYADAQMYRAKQNGGGLFLPEVDLNSAARLEM